jgi:nucleoside-diphosphate-sugar epimerase
MHIFVGFPIVAPFGFEWGTFRETKRKTWMLDKATRVLRDKRVVVVGDTGFLGSWMVKRMREYGAEVVGCSRHAFDSQVYSHIQVDASDYEAFDAVLTLVRPDHVVHLASESAGGRDIDLVHRHLKNDVIASVNCLVASQKRGIHRVLLTTTMEEPVADEPPVSPYAASKHVVGIYGKMFGELYGMDVRLVRPMVTYGGGQKTNKIVPSVILDFLAGRHVTLKSPDRGIDWIYITDTIDGLIAALVAPSRYKQPIDIGSGRLITIKEFVTEIARQLGTEAYLSFQGISDRGREMVRSANTSETYKLLGWRSRVGIPEGLHATIAWYKSAGLANQ